MICSCALATTYAQTYRSFEVRRVANDPAANGVTDFRGPTATMITEERVEFLDRYQREARRHFDAPDLAHEVISDAESADIAAAIKPQPLPEVRQRIPLKEWKYYGYREGKEGRAAAKLLLNGAYPFLETGEGKLTWRQPGRRDWEFSGQSWRMAFTLQLRLGGNAPTKLVFSESGKVIAATIVIAPDGQLSYTTADDKVVTVSEQVDSSAPHTLKLEFDLGAWKRGVDVGRYNLYVDDRKVADYVPIERVVEEGVGYAKNFSSLAKINTLTIAAGAGTALDGLWGVGYQLTGRESYPYTVETFLDEDYELQPAITDWATADYVDSLWATGELPLSYGSERHSREDLYLRKKVYVGDVEKAFWNVETLDPSGALYVNGQLVTRTDKRYPLHVDISDYLVPNDTNTLAVKVDHFYLTERVGELMPHSSLDFNIGWFAGRMWLDLVERVHLKDVFAYTETLSGTNAGGTTATSAGLVIRPTVQNDGFVSFDGTLEVSLSPWFPQEGPAVARQSYPLTALVTDTTTLRLTVPEPELWTPERPRLYKLSVVLRDAEGRAVDDYVVTTGIRTVDQRGGHFNLNGRVSMLNGAQTFGFRSPIETMITDQRNAPAYWVAKEIMQIKRMNGNLLRTHVHAWEFPARGTNDPRYAEYADQLGLMILWCPTSWIRTGRGWRDIDFEGYPLNMRQVRNHPSIVMWEAANHTQSFKDKPYSESNRYVEAVYEMMRPEDPSRLLSVNSFIQHLHYGNDAGTVTYRGEPMEPTYAWTAPGVTRGNQDSPTGYKKDWSELRNWPGDYRQDLLDSEERAYFNFEHQESIGQPNWNLCRGRPWYLLQSYEHEYDEATVGRRLSTDEWAQSQAWQGFSAWEAMKKMRWLDYDGFSWCSLHGGPNSVTYKKPLIDFLGHAKIAWHVNQMIFQRSVAGSYDVDTVYGPDDEITPVINHWGGAASATLVVEVTGENGTPIDRKTYPDVDLPEGRNKVVLPGWRPDFGGEGLYTIAYTLTLDGEDTTKR
ncbi:glycoside hydrolase family 2 TIM barrel-domain containing protein [Neolewinella sp.]|uniref:glycoside hydrolase family 2 TIM barrel-domain containing protein n=1 Tax=Neolewinella sp. TaxID=2993543 RepID=UPI003B52E180